MIYPEYEFIDVAKRFLHAQNRHKNPAISRNTN